MPYASNADLPTEIRDALPEHAQSIFRRVVNSALADGDKESSAFAQAWGAVKQGFEQNEAGEWIAKADPTASDVHVPGTDWKEEELKKVHILKADDDRRMVYGWASVITKNGEVVVDTQGDSIEPHELEKATTEFMSDVRKAQEMHNPGVKGMVVHSFPLIGEIAKSLGIECDQEGWIVGVHVSDSATWQKVKSGELRAFSIGGQGRREEV